MSDGGRLESRPGAGSRRRLGVGLWVLAVLLTGTGVGFALVNARPADMQTTGSPAVDTALAIVGLTFPTVGLLIALRHPGHAVGWLFLAAGVGTSLEDAAVGWATYGLETRPGSLPAPALLGLVADLVWIPTLATGITLLFLVFPDGRLPRDRWRWLTRLAFADMTVYVLATAVNPGPLYYFPEVPNPLGVPVLRGPAQLTVDATSLLVPVLVVAAGVALVQRFRVARGVRRQQMKWFAVAAALLAGAFPILITLDELGVRVAGVAVSEVLFLLLISTLPLAVGVAILRHRLYDIDVVVNRALVYATLTATLVGTYLLGVLAFRALLAPVVGESDLAVAASTLVVAALFRPFRTRIQRAVDRRFYRRKYDAERTLEGFGRALRDRVDLESVTLDLHRTVTSTVQPTGAALWTREPGR